MRAVCLIALLLMHCLAFGQGKTAVLLAETGALQAPWAGGMNACQFGQMDLDGDGRNDLVAFDRHGNRILCFLNKGGVGEVLYQYDDSYACCFPRMTDWVVFADYDSDGRVDIFTYSQGWAGMKVYRNVTEKRPAFEAVVSPYLTSWQDGGEVNLMVTDADYPAVADLDGDGDLDILTFGVLGTFIEKHLNLSVERFGTRDSLVFEKTEYCWGRVAESEEDDLMYLDTCLFGKSMVISKEDSRHRGATFGVRDLTGNGLPDLLLADVDYPSLTFLRNGGSVEQALMVSQESDFPAGCPVRLFSMPVPFFVDVNNDGIDDLLVSPFDPNPLASRGQQSVWLYLNQGTNETPDFHLYSKSFLQDQMIDAGTGASPAFADVNGDGHVDLILGSVGDIDSTYYFYGSLQTHRTAGLHCYLNVGTAQNPIFQFDDADFAGLKSLKKMGLVPTFGDINRDGKPEMLVGTAEGSLLLYDAEWNLVETDFLQYQKLWSSPCLFDVDEDGLLDLAIGNKDGRLSYYQGTANGFEWVTDFWGGVDVRDYSVSYNGYSHPTLFRKGNELLLSVGSEQGRLFLFKIDDLGLGDAFEDVTDRWAEYVGEIDNGFGWRSTSALADLDGDGNFEMVVGNFCGGLQLFGGHVFVNQCVGDFREVAFKIFPNPVKEELAIKIVKGTVQELAVFDLLGKKILSHKGGERMDVRALASGLYFVSVTTDMGVFRQRFVKE